MHTNGNGNDMNETNSHFLLPITQAIKAQELQNNYLGTLQTLVNQYNSAMFRQQTQFQHQSSLIDALLNLNQSIQIHQNTPIIPSLPPSVSVSNTNQTNPSQFPLQSLFPQMPLTTLPNKKTAKPRVNTPRTSTTKKPFKCEQCQKSFRNKSGLSNHSVIHTGNKPHKCTHKYCGKAFARSCDLTRHVRLHTGVKPFKCKYHKCGKAFTRSVQLRLHVMDHTGYRPHKCEMCNKGFKTLQNAQIHMRIHTGEKPYMCQHCKKKFTQSSSLKTHLSSIHSAARRN